MNKIKAVLITIFFIYSWSSLLASKEAPMLAEMVKSGKIPPLEERLPENPLEIGRASCRERV